MDFFESIGAPSSGLDARSPLLLLKDRTDTFACTLLELVQIDAGARSVGTAPLDP